MVQPTIAIHLAEEHGAGHGQTSRASNQKRASHHSISEQSIAWETLADAPQLLHAHLATALRLMQKVELVARQQDT